MGQRSDLQTVLEGLLGSSNVYFQPPNDLIMSYPCIRYSRDNIRTVHANNLPYNQRTRYEVMVITRNPDDPVVGLVAALPECAFDRHYVVNNLNHDVFTLFF